MPTAKLNAATIRDLPNPETGQKIIFDTALPGFGIRVTPGAKTFIVQARVNGRTRRTTIGSSTAFTADEARREAKKMLGQMAGGSDPNSVKAEARARSITLQQALDLYLSGRKLKDRTARHNAYLIQHYFSMFLRRELKLLTPALMVARFDKITTESGEATANLAFRVFRAVYNFARAATATNDGTATLPENPAERISSLRKWHRPRRKQTYLTDDLIGPFFTSLEAIRFEPRKGQGKTFSDYAEFLLRSGLRRTEGATIQWRDVNLKNRTVTVRATKNHGDHTLPLSDQMLAILTRRNEGRAGGFVFYEPGPQGAIPDPRKNLLKLQEAVGFALGFHDLRRTFAVVADRLDLSAFALQRLLNHQTQNVTAGYVVSGVDRLRDPIQRISNEIDRLAGLDKSGPS